MAAEETKGDGGGVVEIGEDVLAAFQALKLRRKHRFIVFKIEEPSYKLTAETASAPKATFEDLKKALPNTEPRYVVYDHEYKTADGRPADKLVLISWQPESSRPHLRTFYSSQKHKCTAAFSGVEDVFARRALDIEVALGMKKADEDSDEESDWDPDA
uniref:ADF-H domain-containing protein n=1 Tax=Bicosoecida sp. CB-2014 TaxID=1486930 RepID=A0A7S1CD20_9STRA|mmetsp:Transcript_20242/g.71554  ORF Transcript_20242/g.71554 Transcript_20242/m.71554 type:complete len:158 (+) Transcript_20242:175-648(+)